MAVLEKKLELEKSMVEAKKLAIKMPSNFQDLNDLKTIAAQAQVVHILSNNLTEFYKLYFDSHIMNLDQVLSYISDSDKKIYDLSVLDTKSEGEYMVDVKNKKVIRLKGSSRSSGNQTVNYTQEEYFTENYEGLVIRRNFARYSPTYRGGDSGIMDKWHELWNFDTKTNTFTGMKIVMFEHHHTYGWIEKR